MPGQLTHHNLLFMVFVGIEIKFCFDSLLSWLTRKIQLFLIFQSVWRHKNHPNMKIIWYEEMKSNLKQVIESLTNFLSYDLHQDQVDQLNDILYIDSFKELLNAKMPMLNGFCRKGKVGDWKNFIHGRENLERWNAWILQNIQNTDITIPSLELSKPLTI